MPFNKKIVASSAPLPAQSANCNGTIIGSVTLVNHGGLSHRLQITLGPGCALLVDGDHCGVFPYCRHCAAGGDCSVGVRNRAIAPIQSFSQPGGTVDILVKTFKGFCQVNSG